MIGIKDMKMPNNCMGCKFCIDTEINWMCLLTDKYVNLNIDNIDINCPLIEIEDK